VHLPISELERSILQARALKRRRRRRSKPRIRIIKQITKERRKSETR
jgi:hypothetical protein